MVRPYRVTIEGPGIVSIKWRASWEQVQRMQELMSDERAAEEDRRRQRKESNERLRVELRAFLEECDPRDNYQRIAMIALFAQEHPDVEDGLVRESIGEWFQMAWQRPPSNPARDLQRAIARGLVTAPKGPGGTIRPTPRARRDARAGRSPRSSSAASESAD